MAAVAGGPDDRSNWTAERRPGTAAFRTAAAGVDRPAIDAIFADPDSKAVEELDVDDGNKEGDEEGHAGGYNFGTFEGVFVRVLLSIWGVIMFLRLSWVVGQAGAGLGVVVILLSNTVTLLTTLSLSAVSTNGEVRGGGAYFMISRSLGHSWGGSIGLVFSVATALSSSIYVLGIAETIVDLAGTLITDSAINDVRIWSVLIVTVILGIVLNGISWESKLQVFLMIVLTLAILMFFVGSFNAEEEDADLGFTGFSSDNWSTNFGPDFRDQSGIAFFTVFAVFFPAATGIMAGANISGDLRDPQKSIPKGTISAIIISMLVYIIMALVFAAVGVRDCAEGADEVCGLYDNRLLSADIALVREIVLVGIFAATFSSALAAVVGAPRIFQAVCKDNLFPKLGYFAKGRGAKNEPVRGYFLTYVIALACVASGSLNAIAPLVTNAFLVSYALINYACFSASHAKSPGWRPAFKYYNKWLSMIGSVLCIAVMFLSEPITALITLFIVWAIYYHLESGDVNVNWGSASAARTFTVAYRQLEKYSLTQAHVKLYRPQLLVLTGTIQERMWLARLAALMVKNSGSVVCCNVIEGSFADNVKIVGKRGPFSMLLPAPTAGMAAGVVLPCAGSPGSGKRGNGAVTGDVEGPESSGVRRGGWSRRASDDGTRAAARSTAAAQVVQDEALAGVFGARRHGDVS